MNVAREYGLVFNSKKCVVKASQISFFDILYDDKGAHPDPKKVEDIQMIPAPTNRTELQEFLGIVTYMGPFVPNLLQNTAMLRDLLKKDVEYQWSQMHQEVFDKVKSSICAETTHMETIQYKLMRQEEDWELSCYRKEDQSHTLPRA